MSRNLATITLVLVLVSTAFSQPLVQRDSLVGGERNNFSGTLGLGFVMGDQNRVVDSLGMIDWGEDGLLNEHSAAIWDSAGTVIASAVIPAGSEGTLVDGFRYAPIEQGPVVLVAGQKYWLGVLVQSGGDAFADSGTATLDSYYIGDNTDWHLGWAGGNEITRTQENSPGGWANQNLYGAYNMANFGAKVVKAVLVAPENAAIIKEDMPTLEFTPGELAVTNNVYFGTDMDAVANATPDSDAFLVNQPEATVTLAEPLERGVTYYWRVDGINDAEPNSPWKGDVWSFFVQPMKAYDVMPLDGTEYVPTSVTVSWSTGANTLLHQVYYGTDMAEVENAANGPLLPLDPPSLLLEDLTSDTIYYWRVDQFTQTGVIKGDIQSFKTVPEFSVADESLLGWWKLDEVNAGSAVDHSGHALHGTIGGTPMPVDGVLGGAWELDGASYAETPIPADVNSNTMTLCGWVKPNRAGAWDGIIFSRSASNTMGLSINGNKEAAYHWAGTRWQYRSGLHVRDMEWSFVALVIEPTKATLVVNDANSVNEEAELEHPARPIEAGFTLGGDSPGWGARNMNGTVDDLRVYTRALTLAELKDVMQVDPPVVEVDPMVVENFDGYAAYDAEPLPVVWEIWSDGFGGNGTSSTVGNTETPYMEIANTAGGACAVPLHYINNGAAYNPDGSPSKTYSEIARVLDPAQDLTRGGAVALKLSIRGAGTNIIEPADELYITLGDGSKSETIVLADADALKKTSWTELTADLTGLSIDLTAVKEIALGIGNPANPQLGGDGVVLIDEIVLSTTLD